MTGKKEKDSADIKVDKWDGNGLKNAIDDAVRHVFLDDLKYSEKNTYVDVRLLLSTLGCAVSLYALAYDFLNPFPKSKIVLIVCVVSYFFMMSVLTLFMSFVEKNIILLAVQKESAGLDPDSQWKVETSMKRFEHHYTIQLTKHKGGTSKSYTGTIKRCVSSWVDIDGKILIEKLKSDIMSCHKDVNSKKEQ